MTPVKQEIKEEEEEMDVEVKAENCGETIGGETDPHQSGGDTVEYRCGNCDITPTRSKSGMDAPY